MTETTHIEIDSTDIKKLFFLKLLQATIAAGIVFGITDYIVDPGVLRAYITDGGLIVSSTVALIIFKKLRKYEVPALIYFCSIIVLMTYQSTKNDGVFNPYFPVSLICFGLLAPVLLSKAFLIAQYIFTVSSFIFMTYYHVNYLQDAAKSIVADSPIGFGVVYVIVYSAIFAVSYYLNMHYEKAQKLVVDLAQSIHEKNNEIEAQNEELLSNQDHLNELNTHLESEVTKRTEKISEQNEKLIKYAYDNAHKVRGPLARILGLLYLRTIDQSNLSRDDIMDKIEHEALQMDSVVREINKELDDNDVK